MSRKIDPARACLHVRDWPDADQVLWTEAVSGENFESEAVIRPNWRPKSVQAYREGYGRWINYLIRSGADLTLVPAERVTPKQVQLYLKELRDQGLAPQTLANRISELLAVMLIFASEDDWDGLRRRFNRLAIIAKHSRKPRPLTKLSGDILGPALKHMRAIRAAGRRDLPGAIEYRNWLMVAMFVLTSLRIDNFANVTIGSHLKLFNGEWMIDISSGQTKQKKRIKMPVPTDLNRHLEFYLEHMRPILLAGHQSNRLWISQRGTAMSGHSIYCAVTNFTKKKLGEAVNPHRFRHIAATSNVIGAPEQIEESRAHLTHTDKRMTEEHYIIGPSLAASRENARLISHLRAQLPRKGT